MALEEAPRFRAAHKLLLEIADKSKHETIRESGEAGMSRRILFLFLVLATMGGAVFAQRFFPRQQGL
jgi:hypothetical protein